MRVSFTAKGWEDYVYWQKQDKKTLKRINLLINDIHRNPFDGIGKPEPLKYELSDFWSRRINDCDRIVYSITNDEIIIHQCRFHYK
ncbi:MAG: Txe/YoeB family addiction module toxin [Planctomycetes bacterium]|nr:Txe/YoeB family addiction module toxin [Planctomycetota bacterium]